MRLSILRQEADDTRIRSPDQRFSAVCGRAGDCPSPRIGERSLDGQVLSQLAGVLLSRGREYLRVMLERKIQNTAGEVVKKGGVHGPVLAAFLPVTKGRRLGQS
jgi:hypothetical protein